MNRINWKLMEPQSIEIRPAMTKNGKTTLLLYQDSRNTMDALDENFGEFGWKISYKDVGGQIYGCLSIKDPETGEWITKEDTGSESNIEAQKGQSSDILKRCAVRFGYGRELYSAPKVVVDDDGYGCSGYKVSGISYDSDRNIIHLTIVNRFGKEVFSWNAENPNPSPAPTISKDDMITNLTQFCTIKKAQMVDTQSLLKFYNFYKDKLENNTFKGQMTSMMVSKLWEKWNSNEKYPKKDVA